MVRNWIDACRITHDAHIEIYYGEILLKSVHYNGRIVCLCKILHQILLLKMCKIFLDDLVF